MHWHPHICRIKNGRLCDQQLWAHGAGNGQYRVWSVLTPLLRKLLHLGC